MTDLCDNDQHLFKWFNEVSYTSYRHFVPFVDTKLLLVYILQIKLHLKKGCIISTHIQGESNVAWRKSW